MLTVAVDDQDVVAGGAPDAALDRGAVALVVGMSHDQRARRLRARAGVVSRSVVHDDNLVPRRRLPERGDDVRDRRSFVVGRDHDRDGRGVGH